MDKKFTIVTEIRSIEMKKHKLPETINVATGLDNKISSPKDSGISTENSNKDEKHQLDKIDTYLKDEFINIFTPYYELLDFEITGYEEKVPNENTEAIFHF